MSNSQSVMVTPDFSMARILRGYVNFEDVYQGKPSTVPVYLSDKKSGKDPVGEEAYGRISAQYKANNGVLPLNDNDLGVDPWLQRGVPVPLGAQCLLYLPYIGTTTPGRGYNYFLIWRVRSPSTYNQLRQPFHSPFDSAGATNNGITEANDMGLGLVPLYTGPATARRVVIAVQESVLFANAKPVSGNAAQDDLPLFLRTSPTVNQLEAPPLFPSLVPGAAVYGYVQQGIGLNGTNPLTKVPGFIPYVTRAKGDELIVGIVPDRGSGEGTPIWNFDASDFNVSFYFGRAGYQTGNPSFATPKQPTRALGVYLFTGSAP